MIFSQPFDLYPYPKLEGHQMNFLSVINHLTNENTYKTEQYAYNSLGKKKFHLYP